MPNPDCSRFPYEHCANCKHYDECRRKCNPLPEFTTLKGLELQMKILR